ncbi:MAG: formyltetrahydrofolate deformylase [Phototrophicaceae bacterium]|jgi:formyltetrahydrofolate deformylase
MGGVSATLLIACPDRSGLIAQITEFIFKQGGNILDLDQHVDAEKNVFFMRVAWDLANFKIPKAEIAAAFEPLAQALQMTWRLHFSDETKRMAIFVSRQGHCLYDLLSRWQANELRVEIPLIISNHSEMEPVAQAFRIPFHKVEISAATRAAAEAEQIALLQAHNVEFVVLARYMQILTSDFVGVFPQQIINIHHSFLPAFIGGTPYHQAYARGVKIIGATSHYVIANLDEGPIIEQDVARVTHKDSVADMIRKGKDLEKVVLARAVWLHLQNRVLIYDNKTVVFA